MMQLHVVVHGRVQGVGFRWFVGETARRLDLAGWVRNKADGSVEVAADGNDSAVELLRSGLAKGPPGANVTSVENLEPLSDPLPKPFSISR
ncbi:MAG TPA: acylphosphatase [Gemmatimonadaceae bacterium]|nr:acylphosphatase [Gemmatimonadaceae bacterium]